VSYEHPHVLILSANSGPPTIPPFQPSVDLDSTPHHVGTMAMVLVVDDDDDLREGIAGLLKDAGYQVSEASNGLEGLNVALSDQPPDLIILDFCMPVIDGVGMRRALEYSAGKFIPVIVISAVMKPQEADTEFNSERTVFVRKPFHAAVILDRVASEIEKARKAQEDRNRERKENG
jgi:CheY-like chemotaxis protein